MCSSNGRKDSKCGVIMRMMEFPCSLDWRAEAVLQHTGCGDQ